MLRVFVAVVKEGLCHSLTVGQVDVAYGGVMQVVLLIGSHFGLVVELHTIATSKEVGWCDGFLISVCLIIGCDATIAVEARSADTINTSRKVVNDGVGGETEWLRAPYLNNARLLALKLTTGTFKLPALNAHVRET